jgi:hypothetical protein
VPNQNGIPGKPYYVSMLQMFAFGHSDQAYGLGLAESVNLSDSSPSSEEIKTTIKSSLSAV